MIHLERDWEMPIGPMDAQAGRQELRRGPQDETRELLAVRLPTIITSYQDGLRKNSEILERQEVSERGWQDVETQIEQLGKLREMLTEFGQDPSAFIPRIQKIDEDNITFTARLRRVNDPNFGIEPENAQIQLSFFAQGYPNTETESEATEALALRRRMTPQGVLDARDRTTQVSKVILNTVEVYRDPITETTKVYGSAGIQLAQVGDKPIAYGIRFVGGHPHELRLGTPIGFTLTHYNHLQQLATRLAGYRPPTNRQQR